MDVVAKIAQARFCGGCFVVAAILAACGRQEKNAPPDPSVSVRSASVAAAPAGARADATIPGAPPDRIASLRADGSGGERAGEVPDGPAAAEPEFEPERSLAPAEFLKAIRDALAANLDPVEVRQLLEGVPADPALLAELKALMNDPASGPALRGYAAEALVRAGTADSVEYVLDDLLAAFQAGDEERISLGLTALEAPTTPEGVEVLFDLLLRQGAYAGNAGKLPPEVLDALRKALLSYPDRELVGELAAQLYFDPDVLADKQAMWELFDGVSHPVMLAHLAARAYEENLAENAAQFLARLGKSDEQGVVQAVVQMSSNPSVPVDDAAGTLYQWSLQHPKDALPGLFIEYVTDSSRPSSERSIAAFGLAGTADPEFARQALDKALANETDPDVKLDLERALALIGSDPR